MDDYTPTTEEVRDWYLGGRNEFDMVGDHQAGEEWSRWLASVRADAWDEGWRVGWGRSPLAPILGNPYRSEKQ